MKVIAPGKIILSGEHAVVYGKPAIALAVNRYVVASAITQVSPLVSFDLSNLAYANDLTFSSLERLKNRIKKKYHDFLLGDFKIRGVLQKPFELAQFALSLCLEILHIKLSQGIRIQVESNIPIGAGMGSSAATILSIMYAFKEHLHLPWDADAFMRLALEAENAQHGISSGLDLYVSLHGGCVYHKNKNTKPRPLPVFPMYFVNTGIPKSSTGECVERAAVHFLRSSIGDDFAHITDAVDALLQVNESTKDFQSLIQANHRLLVTIGVVPLKIKRFISTIEESHGAAKICGAGAVSGNHAGVILVVMEDVRRLKEICNMYGFEILPVAIESRGVHVV